MMWLNKPPTQPIPIEFQYKSQIVNQGCVGLCAVWALLAHPPNIASLTGPTPHHLTRAPAPGKSMINNYAHVPDEAKQRPRTILGKGTSGVALLMREIATGRRVAVKQLSVTFVAATY